MSNEQRPCETNSPSSRICERGTKGCPVRHNEQRLTAKCARWYPYGDNHQAQCGLADGHQGPHGQPPNRDLLAEIDALRAELTQRDKRIEALKTVIVCTAHWNLGASCRELVIAKRLHPSDQCSPCRILAAADDTAKEQG
jgi:hypothetical protein